MANIQRFLKAQQGKDSFPSYKQAYEEIKAGRKQSHWIWYIFPQLKELGFSATAKHFGIVDFTEACDYLKNAELFNNYYAIALLVEEQLKRKIPIEKLMGGSVDAQKLASSLTLFQKASSYLLSQGNTAQDFSGLANCCDRIFSEIAQQGYFPCQKTHKIIESALAKSIKKPPAQALVKEESVKKPPEVIQTGPHDFSGLSSALDSYINERKTEWSFHYNFLGIISLVYWLQDFFTGTDHFNNKSKEIKINAATQLKNIIDNKDETLPLTHAEKTALHEGRLGKIVKDYGGLEGIMQIITKEHEEAEIQSKTLGS